MDTAQGYYSIPGGDAGTLATLGHMRALSVRGAVAPEVRGVAASVVLGAGRDPAMFARLIGDWVDTHTEFLADPTVAEALVPPEMLLRIIEQNGLGQVDCDDVAMLAAALGLSVGLRARFVVVGFQVGGPYAHVWAELAGPSGDVWFPIDPTRPVSGLPTVRRSYIVEVM